MDFYYRGAWRMDWGFGNPNKTAVFIACLALTVWLIACFWRRGFWLALPISTVLCWCVIQTYSRGGMVALLAGVATLLAFAPRPWPKARVMAALAELWILVLLTIFANANLRYGQGILREDPSINSRLEVWQHFPEMLAAAPWGWGWGRSGDAYTQWFQPSNQSVNYLNLLNSHFTLMAEGGWVFSVFYMTGATVILQLCWPGRGWRVRGVPLAVWIALGIGGFFSQVEDSLCIWVVPLLLLGLVIVFRARRKIWPAWRKVGESTAFSSCAVFFVILIGHSLSRLPIREENNAVTIGAGARTTVIYVDRSVMGKLYGHALRKFWSESGINPSDKKYVVTEMPGYRAVTGTSEIIVSGKMARDVGAKPDLPEGAHFILLNPTCFPGEIRCDSQHESKTCVYFGEYAQSLSRSSWEACSSVRYRVIDGAADFIPAWPDAIWKPAGT